jgi:hypothetical protein
MRSLLRPAPLFLLASYLLLTAVPFAPALLGGHIEQPWQMIAVELLAWVAVWSVLQRPAWFHWLLIPAFLALPTELYLFKFYGQGISTHHLGIIAETSPKEALEFLGQKVWLMTGVMVLMVVWWVLTLMAARKATMLAWRGKTRWAALFLLVLLAGLWAYGWEFGIRAKPAQPAAHRAAGSASSPGVAPLAAARRKPGAAQVASVASIGSAIGSAWSRRPRPRHRWTTKRKKKMRSRTAHPSTRPWRRPATWAGSWRNCPTGPARRWASIPSALRGRSAWWRAAPIFTRNANTWPTWAGVAAASASRRTSRKKTRRRKSSSW